MPQRPPLTFWLLLIATICVDTFAFSCVEASYDFGFVPFDALMLSQISVVCIWSELNSKNPIWIRLSPFVAVVVATLVYGMFSRIPFIGKAGEQFSMRMGLVLVNQGLHAALLLAMLWLFKRTAFWKRRSGSTAEWRFSIADALVVMTVVAALGAGIRFTKMFVDAGDWTDFVFLGNSVVLAIASVFVWSHWRTPWVLRASGVIGLALALVAIVLLAEWLDHPGPQRRFPPPPFSIVVATHYLIQALVLIAWLAWGPLLPRAQTENDVPTTND